MPAARTAPGPSARAVARAAAAALACVGVGACAAEPTDPWTDSACERALQAPDSAEASDWLRLPAARPRRLGEFSTEDGLAFVARLEDAGGFVTAVEFRPGPTPDDPPSPRGLVVRLPQDRNPRNAVFALYAAQVRRQGYAPQADTGQVFVHIPCASLSPPT